MAAEHKLSIFRGYLTFKSITQKIWGVLIFGEMININFLLGAFLVLLGTILSTTQKIKRT